MSDSYRQTRASQKNGARSHGPLTPETRRISAQNSRKHGILAASLVLDAEESETFDHLLNDFFVELQPIGELEAGLVQSVAAAYWRILRSRTVEKCLWDGVIIQQDPEADPAIQATTAFLDMTENKTGLKNIERYETTNERRYHRALEELRRTQENRRRTGGPSTGLRLTASISGTFRQRPVLPNEPSPTTGHPENPANDL